MKEGNLYLSRKYETAIHLCACGCGGESVTPTHQPTGWRLTEKDGKVTLHPSILNRFCKAHYWIRDNKVVWS